MFEFNWCDRRERYWLSRALLTELFTGLRWTTQCLSLKNTENDYTYLGVRTISIHPVPENWNNTKSTYAGRHSLSLGIVRVCRWRASRFRDTFPLPGISCRRVVSQLPCAAWLTFWNDWRAAATAGWAGGAPILSSRASSRDELLRC